MQARQRRRRRARSPTRPRPSRWPSGTCPTSAAPREPGTAPDQAAAARPRSPRQRMRVYDVRAVVAHAGRHGLGARAARRASAPGWSRRWPGSRAADRRHRQQPGAPRRRHRRRRRRQGGPLPAAVRRLRPAGAVPVRHARASWSGPRPRRPRPCATSRRMFVDGRQPDGARSSRSCCARATASAPRPWPAAASRRRCSRWPGRPASSAAMGLEGAVRLGLPHASWRRSRTRTSAGGCSSSWSRGAYERGQGAEHGGATSRSTT